MTSALTMPLPARAVDVVFCARLVHHLATPEARVNLLRELARVARRGVVVSFFDADSFKHRRRLRRQAGHGRISGRHGVTEHEMVAEARQAGLSLIRTYRLLPGYAEVVAAAFRLETHESASH